MIKPESVSENFLFSTIKLETTLGIGTGFIFFFKSENGTQSIPVIVTNKHVVNNLEVQKVKFSLHVSNEEKLPSDENIIIEYNANWIFHPDQNVDLCCTPLGPLLFQIQKDLKKDIFYSALTENDILSDAKLNELRAIEDIVMIGYPIGLFDKKNNLPLIRKGITASHPAEDFNGRSEAVADIASFPGSSGSPIFLFNDNGYSDKKGNSFIGARRVALLGILHAGPIFEADGKINIKEIPTNNAITIKSNIMMNLGYYIKAKELLVLKNEVFKKLSINH